jgi:tetratricopeptide (TPR) repeat protein
MADAERALGHPERAIELSRSVEAAALDPAASAELTIVVAGARSDLGQDDAALVGIRTAAEGVDPDAPYAARLYYAYADLLARTGRRDDAIAWFVRAADADADEDTDAGERLTELTDDAESAVSTATVEPDEESGPVQDDLADPVDTEEHRESDADEGGAVEPELDDAVHERQDPSSETQRTGR